MDPISLGLLGYKIGKFGAELWWGTHGEQIELAMEFIEDYEQSNFSHEPSLKKAISILEQIPSNEKDYIVAAKNYFLAVCYYNGKMLSASLRCLDKVASIEIGTFTACADTLAEVKSKSRNFRKTVLEAMNSNSESSTIDEENDGEIEFENFEQCVHAYVNDEYDDIDTFISQLDGLIFNCDTQEEEVNYNLLAAVACLDEFLNIYESRWLTGQKYLIESYLKQGIEYIDNASRLYKSSEIKIIDSCLNVHYNFWVEHNFKSDFYDKNYRNKLNQTINHLSSEIFSEDYIKSLYDLTFTNVLYYCTPTGEEPKIEYDDSCEEEDIEDSETNEEVNVSLRKEEQEYLDEYRDIISEGEISDRNRRFLNKIMKANGINEVRAKQLEQLAMQSSSLSEEEQEYLDEYREIISEGEISARDQRFLDKLKKSNGISDERAKELESMI